MKRIAIILLLLLAGISCREEWALAKPRVSDTFYVENKGASMHVLVEGNLTGHVFLLMVHGGPGGSSLFYHTDYLVEHLENTCAVVYWDQRNAGASQGDYNAADLTLSRMTEDLRKVILVIRQRYGRDSEIFLLGHSFGGLLTSAFMTSGNNQSLVKGWIFVDGSHDYPLNDTLTRQKLLDTGREQINLHVNEDSWKPIVEWCQDHSGPFTQEQSEQLESYASEAEGLIDRVSSASLFSVMARGAFKDNWPLASMLVNYLNSSGSDFNDALYKIRFSSELRRVTVPVLVLYGRYDFTCPVSLGLDFYNKIGSTDKQMAVSEISGHNPMFQDPEFFCDEISDFIAKHR